MKQIGLGTRPRVNKKYSDTGIVGTPKTGFLYNVTWYTDKTMSALDCANMKFDKEILKRVVALAEKIDTAQDQKSYIKTSPPHGSQTAVTRARNP